MELFSALLLALCFSQSLAQLSARETLINQTVCDLNSTSSVLIDCELNNVIGIQQVQYGYSIRCSTICCNTKESGDCLVNATDTTDFKRKCSGESLCNMPVSRSQVFCNFGQLLASYVYIEYYCIPKSRITQVCNGTNQTITSTGEPLYLTNPGYPGATIGTRSCSCSIEAMSCTTGVTLYIIDADLYSEPTICLQNLRLISNNDTQLDSIMCENYYSSYITAKELLENYVQISFDSNSTQNLEGYFFIGFQASDSGFPFNLTCSKQPAALCIDCDKPSNVSNGIITLDTPDWNGYNSTATVTCNPGYNTSTTKIVCRERAIWDNAACYPKDCGNLSIIEFGSITLKDQGNSSYGASATVNCTAGFEPTQSTITCQDNGLWENVSCFAKNCGNVTVIEFGNITLADLNNSTYGASATVVCQSGYDPSNSTVLCLESGVWQNSTCVAKDCMVLPIINFGNVSLVKALNSTHGASATVTCDAGFETNTSTILCLATGYWENASCSAKDCGNVSVIDFGNVTLVEQNNSSFGASATVSCFHGYWTSTPTILCLDTGRWDNATCFIKDCGAVPIINFGNVSIVDAFNSTFGASATVICDSGFETNMSTILCLATGYWENASCKAKDCGAVPIINFGNVSLVDAFNSTFGASATVICDSGFETNSAIILCLGTGYWEDVQSCTAKDCGNVAIIDFGNTTLADPNNSTYGASATLVCQSGYEPSNTAILCLESGVWQTASCADKASTVPETDYSKKVAVTIAVVMVLLVATIVVQLYMHIKLYRANNYTLQTVLGFIPLIGLPVVIYSKIVQHRQNRKVGIDNT